MRIRDAGAIFSLSAILATGCFTKITPTGPAGLTTGGSTTTTGGSSGGGTSGGGTTGAPVPCAVGAVWVGETCALVTCTPQAYGQACATDGGLLGHCAASDCNPAQVSTDPDNCGRLGLACPSGFVCSGGFCVLSDGGVGSCENPLCPIGQACDPNLPTPACDWPTCNSLSEGQPCQLTASTGVCCDLACVAFADDAANCGGCGAICPGGGACRAGRCIVPVNCATAPVNATCLDGTGDAGYCCNGTCFNAFTCDATSCGACGVLPSSGPCGDGGCGVGLACVELDRCAPTDCTGQAEGFACGIADSGLVGRCCGGQCANLSADSANCAVCGGTCPTGTFCWQGQCAPDVGCRVQQGAIPCDLPSNASSTSPATCCNGSCAPALTCTASSCSGQFDGTACDGGLCCAETCIDIATDAQNCGACGLSCVSGTCSAGSCSQPCADTGAACPSGSACFYGSCLDATCAGAPDGVTCAASPLADGRCCGQQCIDRFADPDNCGACGVRCDGGACLFGLCSEGLATNGCSPACPSGATCVLGGCVGSACPSTSDFCVTRNGDISRCCPDQSCPDLSSDPLNCGDCGVICPSGESCQNGRCGTSGCGAANQGFYCNLAVNPTSLCCGATCLDIASDVQNCGGCGRVCLPGQRCLDGGCAN